ncbi:hypothetical protein E2C01_100362 [Portunus trituberculatus]|uniref:Uncharacterized protein n=1 Tax=Portunus trituberculatus TaxID=210409 RepID=A0A5B7KD59_PORTR|nr:hypothetical protein [Portunus trituberculatus]
MVSGAGGPTGRPANSPARETPASAANVNVTHRHRAEEATPALAHTLR